MKTIKYPVSRTSTFKKEIHFKLNTQTGEASDFQIYEGMTELDGMFIADRINKTTVKNIDEIRESAGGIKLYLKDKEKIPNPVLKI